MPAYNFKKQFADDVEALIKRQTFRVDRKDGYVPKAGDLARLYTGQRTKYCRFLGEYKIKGVMRTVIDTYKERVIISGAELTESGMRVYAKNDGFASAYKMFEFFKKEHGCAVLQGHTIRW